jgi:hypothetical protein
LWIVNAGAAATRDCAVHVGSGALPDTGYYVSRTTDGTQLVVDGGPHGFLNGGHAHADALSLTWTVRGVPLLIDCGTGCYTIDGALRDRMRGSAMHNTVTIDGLSQSAPNGPFHWSHMANGRVRRWETGAGFDYFDGSHDGYAPIEHRRRVLVVHGDLVVVADLVDGSGPHLAAVHWHIHPQWTVLTAGRRVVFTPSDRLLPVALVIPHGHVETFVGDRESGLGWCSPVYGRMEKTTTVRVTHQATAPFWTAAVFDATGANAIEDVEWVPVWAEAGAVAHGAALRITRAESTDFVVFAEPSASAAKEEERSGATWRVGEMHTNARMLYWRTNRHRHAELIAVSGGTFTRFGGVERRHIDIRFPLSLPEIPSTRVDTSS